MSDQQQHKNWVTEDGTQMVWFVTENGREVTVVVVGERGIEGLPTEGASGQPGRCPRGPEARGCAHLTPSPTQSGLTQQSVHRGARGVHRLRDAGQGRQRGECVGHEESLSGERLPATPSPSERGSTTFDRETGEPTRTLR